MHPADHLRGSKSNKLRGKRVVLGVTGSIAAVDSVKLCRELIRHGAEVHVAMSKDAQKIINPQSLEFASGLPVTTDIDGRVQHVSLCGDVPDRVDLLLVAPCTANTLSKIACGIDDTTVTTFATTALGSGIPVAVVPAMHGSMIKNAAVLDNIERLKEMGVTVLGPRNEESKAKMPDIDHIVSVVVARIGRRDLVGTKILVIAGATEEPIDDMRVITNRSSGETGIEIARAAFDRGAETQLWIGRSDCAPPSHIPSIRFRTTRDLHEMVSSERLTWDIVLFPAAVSDYTPKKVEGKIPSTEAQMTLTLTRNPKIIDDIRAKTVVGFKAQSNIDDATLVAESVALIERSKCSLVVANLLADVSAGATRVLIVDGKTAPEEVRGTKTEVADRVLDRAARMVR
jgi:phosphopantothenoylcysteine decarboxylase/phosphopantothenate--cysteine ligase